MDRETLSFDTARWAHSLNRAARSICPPERVRLVEFEDCFLSLSVFFKSAGVSLRHVCGRVRTKGENFMILGQCEHGQCQPLG